MKIQDFIVETDKFVEGKETYTKKFRDKTELIVILSTCKSDRSNKKSLMNLWVDSGYLNEFIDEWIGISTYYTDKDGNCSGSFNPQLIFDKRPIIDFKWLLADTKENRQKILKEVIRMYQENIRLKTASNK